jgi:UDP-N-acetylmuramate dehydrogenase
VNLGGGIPAQALELMDFGRNAVRARFGVTLETEVVVLK